MSARDLSVWEWGFLIGTIPWVFPLGLLAGLFQLWNVGSDRMEKTWAKLTMKRQTVEEIVTVVPEGTAVFCGYCGAALTLDTAGALERWSCGEHGIMVLLD